MVFGTFGKLKELDEYLQDNRKQLTLIMKNIEKVEKAEKAEKAERLKKQAEAKKAETDSTAETSANNTATRRSPRKKQRFVHNFKPGDFVKAINHSAGSTYPYSAMVISKNDDGTYTVLCSDGMRFDTSRITPHQADQVFIEYLFPFSIGNKPTGHEWYTGKIVKNTQECWFSVHFDDGDKLDVNISPENYETAWRWGKKKI